MKQRTDTIGKIVAGDLIKHRGEYGTFVVQYVDIFEDREAEVTCIGGASGRKAWRTFRASEIAKCSRRIQASQRN